MLHVFKKTKYISSLSVDMFVDIYALTQSHMWVEFVVGSCPCSETSFPGSPVFLSSFSALNMSKRFDVLFVSFSGFLPSTKTNTANSNSFFDACTLFFA